MHVVEILLPLRDNEGNPFPRASLDRVRHELTERFGGVTAHLRAPAAGAWKDDEGDVARDDVVIVEVMADDAGPRLVGRLPPRAGIPLPPGRDPHPRHRLRAAVGPPTPGRFLAERVRRMPRDRYVGEQHRTAPAGAPPLPTSPPRTQGGEETRIALRTVRLASPFSKALQTFGSRHPPPRSLWGKGRGWGAPTISHQSVRSTGDCSPPQPPPAVSGEVGRWCRRRRGPARSLREAPNSLPKRHPPPGFLGEVRA